MKRMKKLASLVLATIMVLAMALPVGATEVTPQEKGSITITNPVDGHTYTIYRILALESYKNSADDTKGGNYSYKIIDGEDGAKWETFLRQYKITVDGQEKDVFNIDAQKYVTLNEGVTMDAERTAAFAKAALKEAKEKSISNQGSQKYTVAAENPEASTTVEFSELDLGYYLVDSDMGTLCALNTTKPDVDITEKNEAPELKKEVKEDSTGDWGKNADADRGQIVEFQVTITAGKGAQKYVLHDKMGKGLNFIKNTVKVTHKSGSNEAVEIENGKDYNVKTNMGVGEDCTFHVEFTESFCDTLKTGDIITVSYSATVTEYAFLATENKNEAYLKYGENSSFTVRTDPVTVNIWEIPVFKYFMNGTAEKGLADAKFTLSTDEKGENKISFIDGGTTSDETGAKPLYRRATETEISGTETTTFTEITTDEKGHFVLRGLDSGIYYLNEVAAPDGYNKLSGPVEITIDSKGDITVGTAVTNSKLEDKTVKVLNQSGALLPSTGGIGTTIFYVVGGILVAAAVVLLVTRKRMSAEK